VEVELVFIDLVEVFFDVVEVLESHSEVPLSQARGTALSLVPHALHVVNIETLVISLILTEKSHSLFSLLQLVITNEIAGSKRVKVAI
jgi:hypothetical protein